MITEHISVVIVESQPMMRTALSTAISAEGMTVLAEVVDHRDALQTASCLTPDLVLFSVNEPGLKDLERILVLRRELPSVVIVALITGEFRGQFQLALDYGAHLVLTKSTPRWQILDALRKASQKKIYTATAQVD